ncbi:hypothetical protein [Butyrivibrio sp. MC2021]|uniref:hypothetical protein n=1 Tax=Butyrivibrio sp. MC2021 TaxID=1408306 RepID=UPI000479C7FB|nr:hypothetical protein [Butyrivibrio sp. MC2021]
MRIELEEKFKVKGLDEFKEAYKKSGVPEELLDEEYMQLSQFYRFLLRDYFHKLGVFEDTENKMNEMGILEVKEDRKSYFQKTDLMEYKYFFLRSCVRIDRLNDTVKNELKNALENPDDQRLLDRARDFAVSYLPDVLMYDKNDDRLSYVLFPSIYGEGNVKANEIVMDFTSAATYDENGNLVSKSDEDNRIIFMDGQIDNLQQAFQNKTGYRLRLILNGYS